MQTTMTSAEQGAWACKRGFPLDANPYPERTGRRLDWALGWWDWQYAREDAAAADTDVSAPARRGS